MRNFFRSVGFGCLSALCLQVFSFHNVEASEKAFEFNIDVNNFQSLNIMEKVDCFIDFGMEFERSTGKKFKYKELLKKTYKYLEEKGIDVPKQIKKDVQKLVENRISERYFSKNYISKAYNEDGSFKNETLDRHRNEEPYCNDTFRGAVLGAGIGIGLMCTANPIAIAVGGYMLTQEGPVLYQETKNYVYESWYGTSRNTRDSRDRGQANHKDGNKRSMSRD